MQSKQKQAMRTLFGIILTFSGASILLAQISVIARQDKMNAMHLVPLVICCAFIWLGIRLFQANHRELMERGARVFDKREVAKVVRGLEKATDRDYLYDVAINALKDEVSSAAMKRYVALYGPQKAAELAASKYHSLPRLVNALSYVNDNDLLKNIALNAVHQEMGSRAVEKINDPVILKQIADSENCDIRTRVDAMDKIGEKHRADEAVVASPQFIRSQRSQAAADLIASRDREAIERAAESILSGVADDIARDFIADSAKLYPDIYKDMWQHLASWSHIDHTSHTDHTTTAPHVDQVQYYDFYKTPSGQTFANKGGRKKHTDHALPSSDCAEYGHTDSSTHTDTDDRVFLSRLPAAIRPPEEETDE